MQSVSTNLNLQETRRHGSPDFPLEFNTDDTRDYYKNDINWHWHEEFELVYIIEGCVACHINQSVYELQPGEGIFINSSVLHRFTSEKYGIITNVIFLPAFLAAKESLIYRKYVMPLEKAEMPCIVLRKEEVWKKQMLSLLQELFSNLKTAEWNELSIRKSAKRNMASYVFKVEQRTACPENGQWFRPFQENAAGYDSVHPDAF